MTDIKTLQKYEDWKVAKKRRSTWINFLVIVLGILFAFISGNLLCKVGLGGTKKVFSYGFIDKKDLKPENQSKLPKDYTEWYKKVKGNFWVKKWGHKEDYFTKKAIAEREYEENKKKAGGGILGDFAAWWLSKNLSEEEGKKIDYYHYAHHVYIATCGWLILSWILFYILWAIILNLLFRLLIWREPKLET